MAKTTSPVVNVTAAAVEYIRNATSSTNRVQALRRLLDQRRDYDQEFGYPQTPSIEDYDELYRYHGIARRAVQIIPEECWKQFPKIYETEDAGQTEFEKAWKELDRRLGLFASMYRADVLSGIGSFGIILLGFSGSSDLGTPAPSDAELLYLRVFDQTVVNVATKDTNVNSPRYGLPETYTVTFKEPTGVGETNTVKDLSTKTVHWTRVVHLADNRRMSEIYGQSRLQPVFHRLIDLKKLYGGSAEMFWQGAFPGLSLEIPPELLQSQGAITIDTEAVKQELQNYINGLQRWISLTGLTAKSLSPQVADPMNHIEAQVKAVASTLGVPYRIFLGTEEGRLAGTQDAIAWSERVKARRQTYLNPQVIRPFVQRLIDHGSLPVPESFEISWPKYIEQNDKDKAEIAKTRTSALGEYVQKEVEQVFPLERFLDKILGLEPEEAKKIVQELEDEARIMDLESEEEEADDGQISPED